MCIRIVLYSQYQAEAREYLHQMDVEALKVNEAKAANSSIAAAAVKKLTRKKHKKEKKITEHSNTEVIGLEDSASFSSLSLSPLSLRWG